MVLGERFWATRFGSDPNVVGKTISLSGDVYTIVGVLGSFDFREFGPAPQVWIPLSLIPTRATRGIISGSPVG